MKDERDSNPILHRVILEDCEARTLLENYAESVLVLCLFFFFDGYY